MKCPTILWFALLLAIFATSCADNTSKTPDVTLKKSKVYPIKQASGCGNLQTGDLNRDGKLDLVVGASKNIHLFFSGNNDLLPGPILRAPGSHAKVRVVDLDEDGVLDIEIRSGNSVVDDEPETLRWTTQYLNSGRGSFTLQGEVDFDTLDELARTTYRDWTKRVSKEPQKAPPKPRNTKEARENLKKLSKEYGTILDQLGRIDVDLNRDGKIDTIRRATPFMDDVSYWDAIKLLFNMFRQHKAKTGEIEILIAANNEKPLRTVYKTGASPQYPAAGDINGDGHLDIVTFNFHAASVTILRGRGDGSFDPPVDYSVGDRPWTGTVLDVNQDGKDDVLVGRYAQPVVVLYQSQ